MLSAVFSRIAEVEKKWGRQLFNAEQFKTGSEDMRAKMAASLMKNKSLPGKTPLEIWTLLGRHDGYYFSDLIPTYIIHDESTKGGETWQIVFLLDRNNKVKDIRVHKNGSEWF